jgi:hypothetical protein
MYEFGAAEKRISETTFSDLCFPQLLTAGNGEFFCCRVITAHKAYIFTVQIDRMCVKAEIHDSG